MRLALTPRHALLLVFLGALAHSAGAQDLQRLQGLTGGLAFVENRGQWPDEVLFQARLGGGTAWVTRDGLVFDFYEVEREERDPDALPHEEPEATRRGHVVAMRFEGGRARRAVGHGRRQAYHNYFLDDDPDRWASRLPLYDGVVLEGLYDGVDLRLYADGGLLRYDLVLAPGAEASRIRMRMEGADGVALTSSGALAVTTALGQVEHRGLVAYQERDGRPESAFVVGADGAVAFDVRWADPTRRLVIDPLIWATFLGGVDADYVSAVAVGADGRVTVAGETWGPDFPTTLGAYDTSFNGVTDVFVTRLSADGTALLYSAFLGGTTFDLCYAAAVGAEGSTSVVGRTYSMDFPTTPGAYDTSYNGGRYDTDAFVVRLSPDGSTLIYSTFLGGMSAEAARGVAVSADGSATVVGGTTSPDFPTTPGAYDASHNGSGDAFVARLSPDGGTLRYATFLGGADGDYAAAVAIGTDGVATVAGGTSSAGFPTTPSAYDTSHNGGGDGFVVRLDVGATLPFTLAAGALNSPVTPDDTLQVLVVVTNLTPAALVLDLGLDAVGPDGHALSAPLASGVSVAPGATVSAAFDFLVESGVPVGTYSATVTAFGGDNGPLGTATFAFEVTLGVATEPGAGGLAAVVAPNPAAYGAAVAFALDAPAEVRLALYDVLGREVAVVDAGRLSAGARRRALDVSQLPAGVYVWRLVAGERVETGRLTVAR